jgi:hypothetical protein
MAAFHRMGNGLLGRRRREAARLARGSPDDFLADRVLEPPPMGADQVVHATGITQALDDLNMMLAYSPETPPSARENSIRTRTDCKPRSNNRLFRGENEGHAGMVRGNGVVGGNPFCNDVVYGGQVRYLVDATRWKEPSIHDLVVPLVTFSSKAFVPNCLILFLVVPSERAAPPPSGLK